MGYALKAFIYFTAVLCHAFAENGSGLFMALDTEILCDGPDAKR